MSLFRKKPIVIEATQWHKNGDHPLDYAEDTVGPEGGELRHGEIRAGRLVE